MSVNSYTDVDILDLHFKLRARDALHTSFPAKITKVVSANVVNVQPLITTKRADGTTQPYPELLDVRYMTYACQLGDVFVSLPVREGDKVWVMVSERDTFNLMSSDGEEAKASTTQRTHDLSDCFAVPAWFADGAAREFDKDNLVIANKNTKIVVKQNEVEITTETCNINATDVAINASNMVVNATLQVNGDTSINGSVEASGGTFKHNGKNVGSTHTHGGVQSGSGVSGVPT